MKRSVDERGVCLAWPGRVWRTSPSTASVAEPTTLRVLERIGPDAEALRLVHGDGLEVLGALANEGLRGKVDLVYVDPPYASERNYVAEARLDGPADGRALRSLAYEDRWTEERGGLGAYLDMLAPRLEALASLLSPRGTLWVHLDWRASYLVRVLLDEIFGRDAFLNEIVWRRAPNLGRQAASSQFGRTLDTIVVYGRPGATLTPPTRLEPIEPKAIRWDEEGRPFTSAPRGDYTDSSIAKLDAEGRVHRTATGRIYIKYFLVKDSEGRLCRERRVDALWTDVAPLRHAAAAERTGYPTQKPRALLERIIACATSPGALVVDAFGGSGTTGAAAHALGRKAILIDRSPVAIATARARLLRDGASLSVERASTMDASVSSPASASVEVGDDCLRLVSPQEPLAWVVGQEKDGILHATWHSERAPGKKAVPALLEAPCASDKTTRVRVYLDDGTLAVWPLASALG
jgi:DNA modification methylase